MEGQDGSIKRSSKTSPPPQFQLRKFTKAGQSRYLGITNIVPKDWVACKVYVMEQRGDSITLKLVRIT